MTGDALERRMALLRWIAERPEHNGLTTSQIVDVSGLYDPGFVDTCRGDLIALAANGVERQPGRPARWSLPAWKIGAGS